MKRISRSALVPFSSAQMFELINDIERYPEFLPWCTEAKVLSDNYIAGPAGPDDSFSSEGSGREVRAALTIRRGRIVEKFETVNLSKFPSSIEIQLVQGPFKYLKGLWQFKTLGNLGCKTELVLEYEIASSMIEKVISGLVRKTADIMVDAFCEQAGVIYGGVPGAGVKGATS
ncbi:MAG: type II toxin-antitoxin system RatA family toxin [Pseudomonadales bacterium]|nr:type II toxin-antitoxin system RatA family toxin [Pseudomonadales bacterium]